MLAIPPVRLAGPDDAHAIALFSREFIEHGLGWKYTRPRILEAIQSSTINVAVIHERGCVMAFGIMEYQEDAHLVLLGVQPTQRRRGLGQHIFSWLELPAITAGIERILVEARADNPGAVSFYKKQGFRVQASIPGYYRGRIDGIRLEKQLGVLPESTHIYETPGKGGVKPA